MISFSEGATHLIWAILGLIFTIVVLQWAFQAHFKRKR